MVLDNRTILYLSIAIIAVISALLPFSSSYSGTRNERLWEGSNLSLLAGFLLLSTQGYLSPWLSVVPANMLILLSFILIAATVTESVGSHFPWKFFIIFLSVISGFIFWFSIVSPQTWIRIEVVSISAVTICAFAAMQLIRAGREAPGRGAGSLSTAFYILGAANLSRVFLMSPEITSVFNDFATTVTFLSTLAAFLAWNFGMFDHQVRRYSAERN